MKLAIVFVVGLAIGFAGGFVTYDILYGAKFQAIEDHLGK